MSGRVVQTCPFDPLPVRPRDKQHTIMRIGFLGLYPAKQLVESILQSGASHEKAILDIGAYAKFFFFRIRCPFVDMFSIGLGCGTGQW